MRRWFATLTAMLLILASGADFAWGHPLDTARQRQLLALYSRFNRAIASGQLDLALALRSDTVRETLMRQLATSKDRADYLAAVAQTIPDRLEPRHSSVNNAGDKATLLMLADKTAATGQIQSELDISFVKQAGSWKLGDITSGPGPAEIRRCKDSSYEPASAFDASHPIALIGRIESVEFQPNDTVIKVLSGATETCALLPSRDVMRQRGLDPATLQPYRVAEITGAASRTDPQKLMVDNITVHAEE